MLSRMIVRNFFTFHVLPDRTPRGGKLRNTGGSGPFGLWHLEKSRAQAENGKTQFPGARGPKIEKSYHAIRDDCPQLFYILRFARPDPQGREIAQYWLSRPFWPLALREITGAG